MSDNLFDKPLTHNSTEKRRILNAYSLLESGLYSEIKSLIWTNHIMPAAKLVHF